MDMSQDSQVMEDLIKLLDSTGELRLILEQVDNAPSQAPSDILSNDSFSSSSTFTSARRNILHFKPVIHMSLAADISLELYESLQNYPNAVELIKNLIWKICRLKESEAILNRAQICITPHVIGLVNIDERITDVRLIPGPHNKFKSQFLSLRGQLVCRSSRVKYISSTSYSCTNEECCSRTETVYVRVYPLHGEAVGIHQECEMCGWKLEEEYQRRDVGERVRGLIIPESSALNISAVRKQPLIALFKEDIADLLQLGHTYEIVFLPVHEKIGNTYTILLEVFSAIPIEDPWSRQFKVSGEIQISSGIYEIYKDRLLSPWSFVLTLAYLIGGKVTPPGTYHKLKIGLLLSLVSESKRLHILVAGSDMEFPRRLLCHCAELAPRHVLYNSGTRLVGDTRDKFFIDAGLVHLAHNGICYMENLTTCKVMDEVRILIESNTVTSPHLKHDTAIVQPLTTAIWAHLDIKSLKCKPSSDRITHTYKIKSLVDLFGMVFYVETEDGTADHTLDAIITKHSLDAASNGYNGFIPIETVHQRDFATFLQQVRSRKLEFQPMATRMIRQYFLSSRFVRQATTNGAEIPQSALPTLLKLAENHAKVALHLTVTEDDSLMACYLYEESLAAQYGYSHLDVIPSPNIVDGTLGEILGKGNDLKMRQFQEKLIRFTSEFGGEDATFVSGWEE